MSKSKIKFYFILPAVVWVFVFTIFPLCYSLYISFFNVKNRVLIERVKEPVLDESGNPILLESGKPKTKTKINKKQVYDSTFVGGGNYLRMFGDPQLKDAVRVSLLFLLFTIPIEIVLGFVIALLFQVNLWGRNFLRAIMILPIFTTPIAVGYLFFTIFYEEGGPLGFTNIPFLSNPNVALFSVALVDIWQWTPFCFLIFLAAIQSLSKDVYEAALIDGAGKLSMVFKIVIPLITPTIMLVFLLRLTEALKLFDIPFALTGGGPGTATQPYSLFTFRTGLRFFDVGYASAMSYGLLIFVMIVIVLSVKKIKQVYT